MQFLLIKNTDNTIAYKSFFSTNTPNCFMNFWTFLAHAVYKAVSTCMLGSPSSYDATSCLLPAVSHHISSSRHRNIALFFAVWLLHSCSSPRELPDSPVLTLCLCSHCSPVQNKHITHHPPQLLPCVVLNLSADSVSRPLPRDEWTVHGGGLLCSCITASILPSRGHAPSLHIPRIWASQRKEN